jgi:hypothetical protein
MTKNVTLFIEVLQKHYFHLFTRFSFYADRKNLMCEFSVQSAPNHLHSAGSAAYDNEVDGSEQNMCSCLRLSGGTLRWPD